MSFTPLATRPAPIHPLDDPSLPVAFCVTRALQYEKKKGLDWSRFLDVAFFLSLLSVGGVLLYIRKELRISTFGSILCEAGLTPLLLTTWSLTTGGSSVFRRQNIIKACSAAIVFSVGFRLLQQQDEADLIAILAPACLELGVVFFITKFFFLAEDLELQVERLESELEKAKKSPGVGLALSYYFNFVLPTAQACGSGLAELSVSDPAGEEELRVAANHRFFILLPRDLGSIDVKQQLRALDCWQGRPVAKGQEHRPMFLSFLEHSIAEESASIPFDVPTVLHSCWSRALIEGRAGDGVASEVLDFQNELQRLCMENPVTAQFVSIVSIPPAPFHRGQLLHMCRKIMAL